MGRPWHEPVASISGRDSMTKSFRQIFSSRLGDILGGDGGQESQAAHVDAKNGGG